MSKNQVRVTLRRKTARGISLMIFYNGIGTLSSLTLT